MVGKEKMEEEPEGVVIGVAQWGGGRVVAQVIFSPFFLNQIIPPVTLLDY